MNDFILLKVRKEWGRDFAKASERLNQQIQIIGQRQKTEGAPKYLKLKAGRGSPVIPLKRRNETQNLSTAKVSLLQPLFLTVTRRARNEAPLQPRSSCNDLA